LIGGISKNAKIGKNNLQITTPRPLESYMILPDQTMGETFFQEI
jgi:hypothetical protein